MVTRLVAKIRALLPSDWVGAAGRRFRRAMGQIAEFSEEHGAYPEDLADETVKLAVRKIEGLANKEFATAVKDFAEAELTRIEAELQRRSLRSKVDKEEEEARLARVRRLEAELDLLKKMAEIGVTFLRDEEGNLTVLPVTKDFDFEELAQCIKALQRKNLPPAS